MASARKKIRISLIGADSVEIKSSLKIVTVTDASWLDKAGLRDYITFAVHAYCIEHFSSV